MFKKLLTSIALCALSVPALAVTIPGESAFCMNNCLDSVCRPVVTTAGAANFSIGVPLAVYDFNTRRFEQAYYYVWAQTIQANGAPTNLGGMASDTTASWTFATVQPADAGLYVEIGYVAGAGSQAFNWCVTVN